MSINSELARQFRDAAEDILTKLHEEAEEEKQEMEDEEEEMDDLHISSCIETARECLEKYNRVLDTGIPAEPKIKSDSDIKSTSSLVTALQEASEYSIKQKEVKSRLDDICGLDGDDEEKEEEHDNGIVIPNSGLFSKINRKMVLYKKSTISGEHIKSSSLLQLIIRRSIAAKYIIDYKRLNGEINIKAIPLVDHVGDMIVDLEIYEPGDYDAVKKYGDDILNLVDFVGSRKTIMQEISEPTKFKIASTIKMIPSQPTTKRFLTITQPIVQLREYKCKDLPSIFEVPSFRYALKCLTEDIGADAANQYFTETFKLNVTTMEEEIKYMRWYNSMMMRDYLTCSIFDMHIPMWYSNRFVIWDNYIKTHNKRFDRNNLSKYECIICGRKSVINAINTNTAKYKFDHCDGEVYIKDVTDQSNIGGLLAPRDRGYSDPHYSIYSEGECCLSVYCSGERMIFGDEDIKQIIKQGKDLLRDCRISDAKDTEDISRRVSNNSIHTFNLFHPITKRHISGDVDGRRKTVQGKDKEGNEVKLTAEQLETLYQPIIGSPDTNYFLYTDTNDNHSFYGANNTIERDHMYLRLLESGQTVHEKIYGSAPLRPYMDLDIDLTKTIGISLEEIEQKVVVILNSFAECIAKLGHKSEGKSALVYVGYFNDKKKWSMHVLPSDPTFRIPNTEVLKDIYDSINASCNLGFAAAWIDYQACCKNITSLRLPFCVKYSKGERQDWKILYPIGEASIEYHNKYGLGGWFVQEAGLSLAVPFTNAIANATAPSTCIPFWMAHKSINNAATVTVTNLARKEYSGSSESIVVDAVRAFIYAGNNFEDDVTVDGDRFRIKRADRSYCVACEREHESDNAWGYINGTIVSFYCCRDSRPKGQKVPMYIYGTNDKKGADSSLMGKTPKVKDDHYDTIIEGTYKGYTMTHNGYKEHNITIKPEFINSKRCSDALGNEVPTTDIYLKSCYGTGKTEYMRIIMEQLPANASVLFVSCRKSLSRQISTRLNMKVYGDFVGELDSKEYPRLVCQIESLNRVTGHWDFVIIDEATALEGHCSQMGVDHDGKSRVKVPSNFEKIITECNRLMVLDNDLNSMQVVYYSALRIASPFRVIVNTATVWDVTVTLHTGHGIRIAFETYLKSRIEALNDNPNNPSIIVASHSRDEAERIYDMILKWELFDINKVGLYTKDTSSEEKRVHYADPNEAWKDKRIIIYSPTITVGVSCDLPEFTECVAYFNNDKISSTTSMQMVARFRNTKTVHIFNAVSKMRGWPTTEEYVLSAAKRAYIGSCDDPVTKSIDTQFADLVVPTFRSRMWMSAAINLFRTKVDPEARLISLIKKAAWKLEPIVIHYEEGDDSMIGELHNRITGMRETFTKYFNESIEIAGRIRKTEGIVVTNLVMPSSQLDIDYHIALADKKDEIINEYPLPEADEMLKDIVKQERISEQMMELMRHKLRIIEHKFELHLLKIKLDIFHKVDACWEGVGRTLLSKLNRLRLSKAEQLIGLERRLSEIQLQIDNGDIGYEFIYIMNDTEHKKEMDKLSQQRAIEMFLLGFSAVPRMVERRRKRKLQMDEMGNRVHIPIGDLTRAESIANDICDVCDTWRVDATTINYLWYRHFRAYAAQEETRKQLLTNPAESIQVNDKLEKDDDYGLTNQEYYRNTRGAAIYYRYEREKLIKDTIRILDIDINPEDPNVLIEMTDLDIETKNAELESLYARIRLNCQRLFGHFAPSMNHFKSDLQYRIALLNVVLSKVGCKISIESQACKWVTGKGMEKDISTMEKEIKKEYAEKKRLMKSDIEGSAREKRTAKALLNERLEKERDETIEKNSIEIQSHYKTNNDSKYNVILSWLAYKIQVIPTPNPPFFIKIK